MNVLEMISLSSWESFVTLLYLIISFTILILLIKKKVKWGNVIFTSIILGFIGGGILATMYFTDEVFNPNYPVPPIFPSVELVPTWYYEANDWLNIVPTLFIRITIFFVPILIFSTIVKIFSSDNSNQGKILGISIPIFILIAVMGSLITLAFWPLFNLLSGSIPKTDSLFNDGINTATTSIFSWIPNSLSIFVSPVTTFSIIIFSIILSLSLKFIDEEKHSSKESFVNFIDKLNELIIESLAFISKAIPFVICSKIPVLFFGNNDVLELTSIIWFMLILILIFVIVFIILTAISIPLIKGDNKMGKWFSSFKETLIVGFFTGSSYTSVPYAMNGMEQIDINYKVNSISTPLGSVMGLVASSGIYPTAICLATIALSGDALTASNVIVILLSTALISFSIPGTSNSSTVSTTTMLSMLKLDFGFYSMMIAFDVFVDMFRTSINLVGIITSIILIDKLSLIYKKEIIN